MLKSKIIVKKIKSLTIRVSLKHVANTGWYAENKLLKIDINRLIDLKRDMGVKKSQFNFASKKKKKWKTRRNN